MVESDRKKFVEIMYGVADNFGGQISREGYLIRFQAMQDLTIDQVSLAATNLINNRSKTFPAVPTVKEFRGALQSASAPTVSMQTMAEIQAGEVLAMLRKGGRNASGSFRDPTTAHLMSRRWPYKSWAAQVMEKDLTWWKKDFIAAYIANAEVEHAHIIALPGSNPATKRLEDFAKKIGGAR